ncbi:MAG: hypothetical protein LBU64_06005 [Planctomycetota bacterium]|jgi:serine/threonine-protein kinase|nr:hypothetical protein [Planctomycetota bacterium]
MTGPDPAIPSSPPAVSPFADGLLAGQPFTGYRLRECLDSDDRRAVFQAETAGSPGMAVIKAIRPWPDRPGTAEDFFSLAGGIARLRCPSAARGRDAGRGGGAFFLAYDPVPGETLARRQTGRIGESEALRLVVELARALRDIYEHGHTHGNLKPSNIMLAPKGGKAALLDIGFAWTLAWPDDRAAFLAKSEFLPPERIAGELNVDIRGDLYSLGAIWHWLLFGEPPFKAAAPEEALRLRLESPPVFPRERDPRLSAATSGLMTRLLEKDRDARPRTPGDLMRKLSDHPLLGERETLREGTGDGEAPLRDGV